jgi:hypothetical protein
MATLINDYDVDPSWSNEVELVLEEVLKNSIRLSKIHSGNYYYYAQHSQYFDLPIIIISTFSATFAIGATLYIAQSHVTTIVSLLSMVIAILTSIKLYLNLGAKLKNENNMATEFNTLSLNLAKTLKLSRWQRDGDGIQYLDKIYSEYIKLVEAAALPSGEAEHSFIYYVPNSTSL